MEFALPPVPALGSRACNHTPAGATKMAHGPWAILQSIPLEGIVRIDAGLEGDWSGSVVPVWTRAEGRLRFDDVVRVHARYRPSLELYFDEAWVGMHCYRRQGGENVFDEDLALEVIRWIESRTGG